LDILHGEDFPFYHFQEVTEIPSDFQSEPEDAVLLHLEVTDQRRVSLAFFIQNHALLQA